MPDAAGIVGFNYHPPTLESEATPEGGKAREAFKDVEATPAAQDPMLLLRGKIR
jgi:hypothetical protein